MKNRVEVLPPEDTHIIIKGGDGGINLEVFEFTYVNEVGEEETELIALRDSTNIGAAVDKFHERIDAEVVSNIAYLGVLYID